MQFAEQKTTSATIEKLCATPRSLSFQSKHAWMFRSNYMASYLQERADNGAGLNSNIAAMMAAGPLGWLLRETRPTLSGLFSERDVTALMDCYLGDIFFPDQMDCIVSDLCDLLGVELDDYERSSIRPLIDRLRSLSVAQRVTLADAVEQARHRGMEQEHISLEEFFATLGIDLV